MTIGTAATTRVLSTAAVVHARIRNRIQRKLSDINLLVHPRYKIRGNS
jgi:hypothetical protein